MNVTVKGNVPDSGLVYVTIHLDYGLKKTGNYTSDQYKNATHPEKPIINYEEYEFSYAVGGTVLDSRIIENENVFKRDPGFAGIVKNGNDDPVAGVKVEIYGPDGKLLATVYTDEDGWYFFNYKHTGKAATYKIKISYNGYTKEQSVTLKANQIVQVDFTVP